MADGVDVTMLWWHLWEQQQLGRRGYLQITHRELAENLGVTRGRVSQIIGAMVEAGQLEASKSRGRYVVVDPSQSASAAASSNA
jgi:DNA-binding MarR family transcriptional regulator